MRRLLLLVLLVAGCSSDPKRSEAIAHIGSMPRPPQTPFEPKVVKILPAPPAASAGKYLRESEFLQATGAVVQVQFPGWNPGLKEFLALYKDGSTAPVMDVRSPVQEQKMRRIGGRTETIMLNGKQVSAPVRLRLPKEMVLDVAVPAGYSPDFIGLLAQGYRNQRELRLKLPQPQQTDVESLPLVNQLRVNGGSVSVSSTPRSDNVRFEVCADSVKHLQLVMRLNRTRWSSKPGPWFVLDANAKGTDRKEFRVSLPPNSKMMEFEVIPVETRVIREAATIPNVGEVSGQSIIARRDLETTTPMGTRIRLSSMPQCHSKGGKGLWTIEWESFVTAPGGKENSTHEDDPLINQSFVSSLSLTKQPAVVAHNRDLDPFFSLKGHPQQGALGDAEVRVVHLKRTVHEKQLLRLEAQVAIN